MLTNKNIFSSLLAAEILMISFVLNFKCKIYRFQQHIDTAQRFNSSFQSIICKTLEDFMGIICSKELHDLFPAWRNVMGTQKSQFSHGYFSI